jgi:hypothetical protein
MEMHSVTSQILALWVSSERSDCEIEGVLSVDALTFGNGVGFGNLPRKSFVGNVKCINESICVIGEAAIGRGHSIRGGFFYTIKPLRLGQLPAVPFLITEDLEIQRVFVGSIGIELTSDDSNFLRGSEIDRCITIGANNWFGVGYVDGITEAFAVLRVLAFSTNPAIRPKLGEMIGELEIAENLGIICEIK